MHPDTPADGAPKPFTDAEWPAIRARLTAYAERVGIPIDPPRRNVNSRLALETGELVREHAGDAALARFHHAVSRAFFAEQANIAALDVIIAQARPFGVDAKAVRDGWATHRYGAAIDASMRAARRAGVSGVPAYGWDGDEAVSGMMEAAQIVRILRARLPRDDFGSVT